MEEPVIYPSLENRKPLTDREREELAAYAMRHYFSDKQAEKPWYRPEVTAENVLEELRKPSSPISPICLEDLWRDKVSLEGLALNRLDAPQTVEVYLARESNESPSYEKWETTINSMRNEFGGITRAMIAKIASKGLSKIRWLFNGVEPENMSPEDDLLLDDKINQARKKTAFWFSRMLWEHSGKVMRFLVMLQSKGVLTRTEFELITEDEFQTLCALAQLKQEEIADFLLDDIEEDNNLLRTFQNAVSHFVFADMRLAIRSNEDEA